MVERNRYLRKLIDKMDNGMIKIVTCVRRYGKLQLFYKF